MGVGAGVEGCRLKCRGRRQNGGHVYLVSWFGVTAVHVAPLPPSLYSNGHEEMRTKKERQYLYLYLYLYPHHTHTPTFQLLLSPSFSLCTPYIVIRHTTGVINFNVNTLGIHPRPLSIRTYVRPRVHIIR